MAVSSAALAGYEYTRMADDKPILAPQRIPISPLVARWTEVGATTSTDRTLSTAPSRWVYDGRPGLASTPDATSSSTWYLVFDLAAAGIEFDCCGIMGHNFGTLALTTVQLQVADDAAFSSNLKTLADFGSPSNDDRLASIELYHTGSAALRYGGVRYLRIKLSRATPFTPEIGELLIGRRRQLAFKAQRPFDVYALSENSEISETDSGVLHKVTYSRRAYELAAEFWVTTAAHRLDLVEFFRECRGLFMWWENPASAPAAWHMMMRGGPFVMPRIGVNRYQNRLSAREQGPEQFYLDVEQNG